MKKRPTVQGKDKAGKRFVKFDEPTAEKKPEKKTKQEYKKESYDK